MSWKSFKQSSHNPANIKFTKLILSRSTSHTKNHTRTHQDSRIWVFWGRRRSAANMVWRRRWGWARRPGRWSRLHIWQFAFVRPWFLSFWEMLSQLTVKINWKSTLIGIKHFPVDIESHWKVAHTRDTIFRCEVFSREKSELWLKVGQHPKISLSQKKLVKKTC